MYAMCLHVWPCSRVACPLYRCRRSMASSVLGRTHSIPRSSAASPSASDLFRTTIEPIPHHDHRQPHFGKGPIPQHGSNQFRPRSSAASLRQVAYSAPRSNPVRMYIPQSSAASLRQWPELFSSRKKGRTVMHPTVPLQCSPVGKSTFGWALLLLRPEADFLPQSARPLFRGVSPDGDRARKGRHGNQIYLTTPGHTCNW